MDFYSYTEQYLKETIKIEELINKNTIVEMINIFNNIKSNDGRLFILGVGGSAGNASHAVNDFRKIAGIEAYAPTDNISELTARTNDEGWGTVFSEWLKISKISEKDGLLILSVGGGSETTSINLKEAIDLAKLKNARITAIVSRDGGYSAKNADVCLTVPVISNERITPHAEEWQGIIWHLIVNSISSCQ